MSIAIGELRRRLTLEAASDTPDGAGGAIRAWVPVGSVFARVEPRRRRESVEDGRAVGVVTHCVTIRRRDDVDALGLQLRELLDVGWKVESLAAGREGAGDGDEDDLLACPVLVGVVFLWL